MMFGAGESQTPLINTIIMKDDHLFTPDHTGPGPLPHLVTRPEGWAYSMSPCWSRSINLEKKT